MAKILDIAEIRIRFVPPPGWTDAQYDRAIRQIDDLDLAYVADQAVRKALTTRFALEGVRVVTTTSGDS